MTETADYDATSPLTIADVKALGEAVLTDDSGVAVGFDHHAVERIVAQALWQAASDVEDECSAQAVPCFCGSAKWLRARAERITRVIPPAMCDCGHPPTDHTNTEGCMHLCDCAWP